MLTREEAYYWYVYLGLFPYLITAPEELVPIFQELKVIEYMRRYNVTLRLDN